MPPTQTASSCDPEKTRQWHGHLKHKKHLAEQEEERRMRRGLTPRKKKKA